MPIKWKKCSPLLSLFLLCRGQFWTSSAVPQAHWNQIIHASVTSSPGLLFLPLYIPLLLSRGEKHIHINIRHRNGNFVNLSHETFSFHQQLCNLADARRGTVDQLVFRCQIKRLCLSYIRPSGVTSSIGLLDNAKKGDFVIGQPDEPQNPCWHSPSESRSLQEKNEIK